MDCGCKAAHTHLLSEKFRKNNYRLGMLAGICSPSYSIHSPQLASWNTWEKECFVAPDIEGLTF
jgi:hypothetical protein